ncbi:MAG: sel1 repeat family protein [Treponema sp.]|nr:sel1 repeat family protein [Treponema sp.]
MNNHFFNFDEEDLRSKICERRFESLTYHEKIKQVYINNWKIESMSIARRILSGYWNKLSDLDTLLNYRNKSPEHEIAIKLILPCILPYYIDKTIPSDYKKDYTKATICYLKATKQENAESQFYLGNMYFFGNYVMQNYEKAFEQYTKAAEQGYPKALVNLGGMYLLGKYVKQDYNIAIEYYKKATEQDNSYAMIYTESLRSIE